MSIQSDANAAYADDTPVAKDDVRALWGQVQGHVSSGTNPHGVTKAQVGLGNADNTSDADKPVSTAQQAALDSKANLARWNLNFGNVPIKVDRSNNLVKYGRFISVRHNSAWLDVNPADYALTNFDLPLATTATANFHYVDLSLVGVSNPVLSLSGGGAPEGNEQIIPLGVSRYGHFQNFWGARVIDLDMPPEINTLALQSEVVIDFNGRLGGGPAVYLPATAIYVRSRDLSENQAPTNAESAELPGYVKIAPAADFGTLFMVLYDADTNEFVGQVYSDPPHGTDNPLIPIVSVWGDGFASLPGVRVVKYDDVARAIDLDRRFNWADFAASSAYRRLVGLTNDPAEQMAFQGSGFASAISELLMAIADGAGNVAFGIDRNGSVLVDAIKAVAKVSGPNFEVPSASADGHAFAIEDGSGRLALALTAIGDLLVSGGAKLGGGEIDWDFAIADANGNVAFGIKDGTLRMSSLVSLEGSLTEQDQRNKSWTDALHAGTVDSVQLPTGGLNTIVNYGQSLGEGNETWPSLSKSGVNGAKMLGDNVDNIAASGSYSTIGAAQLNPLVAYTRSGSSNLSDAQEAALSPGDQAVGEPPVIGLANGFKWSLNRRALSENDGRDVVAISAAIGGKTIEQLSKINTHDGVDRYGLVTSGVSAVHALRGSVSHVVPIVTWVQGEWNYQDRGASWDKASYKTLLHQLFDDFATDIPAETGQALPPLFMSYQTGAAYTRDVDSAGNAGLHVGMAQLEVTLERDDAVMVGPVYPYTDKGGHLDSNGSRWFGHQMAKVARKVLVEGKPWQPLRPIEIQQSGLNIYVHFHVPVPPLRFDQPYVVLADTDYPDKGFRVTSADGNTTFTIASVEIVSDTIVKITTTSAAPSDALVWYASQTASNGNGNLRDSDPAVAIDNYEFVPERGMYDGANIPGLVDKPYPLHNWCVAFCVPATFSEID